MMVINSKYNNTKTPLYDVVFANLLVYPTQPILLFT